MLIVCKIEDFDHMIDGFSKSVYIPGLFHDLRYCSHDCEIEILITGGTLTIEQAEALLKIIRTVPQIKNCTFDVKEYYKPALFQIRNKIISDIDIVLGQRSKETCSPKPIP